MLELVTRGGGQAFFQYDDESDKTWTYATSDSMWEKYLTTGICQGINDSWMDHTGTVLNQITYIRSGTNKLPMQNKSNSIAYNTNENALLYQDRKQHFFPYVQGRAIKAPDKQVLLPLSNVSGGNSEIVSSSSTSISLLLPSSALSSVHLTNADKLLGVSSTSVCDLPVPVPAASLYVQPTTLGTVTQTFQPSIGQQVMIVPQSLIETPGVKTSVGHAMLMPVERKVSLLSPINNKVFMPYSCLEKTDSQKQVTFPVTYTDSSGLRKVIVAQKYDQSQQVQITDPKANNDPQLPVFSLLVSTAGKTPANSGKSLLSVPTSTPVAAISKDKKKTLFEDISVKPAESPASNSAILTDEIKYVDGDRSISLSVGAPSNTSSMDCSLTPNNSEKPIGAKSEIIDTDELVVGKTEDFNKLSPYIKYEGKVKNIPAQSSKDKLDSDDANSSCKKKRKADSNNDNNDRIGKLKMQTSNEKTTQNDKCDAAMVVPDSEESGNEDSDASEEGEDSFSSDEEEAHCEICGELYNVRRDNKRMGRWIGCEKDCGVWVHRKCVGWTEDMVDTQSYYCDKCQLERLCRLDESL